MTSKSTNDLGDTLMRPQTGQEPYPVYASLRDAGPVVWSDALGAWMVGHQEEIRHVLGSPELFSSEGIKGLNVLRLPSELRARVPLVEKIGLTPALVFADEPTHTRHRKLVNRPLAPRALMGRQEWMAQHVSRLVDAMSQKANPDVVNDLALPLSLGVVVEMFGASMEDIPLYLEVSTAQREFFAAYDPSPELALETEETERRFYDHLREQVATKREEPDESLLSALIEPDENGNVMGEDELFVVCHVFLTAAFETTAAAISSTIYGLLTHRSQLRQLYEDRAKIKEAFEEGVRWESPIQRLVRIAAKDSELGGRQIKRGDVLSLYLAAANRDPGLFADPDRFDIDRDRRRQVPFGYGIHFCVGSALGRLEGGVALQALLDRFDDMAPAAGWSPEWTRYPQSRMLSTLPIEVS